MTREQAELKVEMLSIAKKLVKASIKKENQRLGDYTATEVKNLALDVLSQHKKEITRLAKQAIAQRNRTPDEIIGKFLTTMRKRRAK